MNHLKPALIMTIKNRDYTEIDQICHNILPKHSYTLYTFFVLQNIESTILENLLPLITEFNNPTTEKEIGRESKRKRERERKRGIRSMQLNLGGLNMLLHKKYLRGHP